MQDWFALFIYSIHQLLSQLEHLVLGILLLESMSGAPDYLLQICEMKALWVSNVSQNISKGTKARKSFKYPHKDQLINIHDNIIGIWH